MNRVRYAVVGLGYISQIAMLPAFAGARRNSDLVALVSGDQRKLRTLGDRYGVPILGGYDDFDEICQSGEIDAVYIGLPNTMHREYTERAAKNGIHVLCEKPLATSVEDCRAMINACADNGVELMTAYRLHFEPGTLAVMDYVHSGRIGEPRYFTSQFSMQVRRGNIRTRGDLGGGPLLDLGVYCIQAARHLFRAEPIEVFGQFASSPDARFRDVEEIAQVALRFPRDRMASFTVAFSTVDASAFQIYGTSGSARLDQAYEMTGGKTAHFTWTSEGETKERSQSFTGVDQFAPLLLEFSECILNGEKACPSGEEGLADIRVVEAVRQSARTGQAVLLPLRQPPDPEPTQDAARRIAAHSAPKLVKAQHASV